MAAFYRTHVQELLHFQIFGNDKEAREEPQRGKQSLQTVCDQRMALHSGDELHSSQAFYLLCMSHHMGQKSGALHWFSPGFGHGINASNEYNSSKFTNII